MNRPIGVTIIGVLNILFGLVGICIGMTAATNAMLVAMAGAVGTSLVGGSLIILAAATIAMFLVLLNGVQFYVGIGLLMLQRWAHTWARILAVIGLVAGAAQIIVSFLGGNLDITFPLGTGLNSIIIQAIVLIYLSRPEVKTAFTY